MGGMEAELTTQEGRSEAGGRESELWPECAQALSPSVSASLISIPSLTSCPPNLLLSHVGMKWLTPTPREGRRRRERPSEA
eukprot:1737099-Pyramimonas_sp.AAC.1